MESFERKEQILILVRDEGKVSVNELADRFDVTKVTVRSDIDDLARRGLVVRTHGGAVPPENYTYARLIGETIHERTAEKEAIARSALRFIVPGNTLLLDAGSTTVFLAREVKNLRLTVVTNSVMVLQELYGSESIDLFVSGGGLRKPDLALIGEMSHGFFEQVRADIVFLGATSYSFEKGISCSNLVEARTKKEMLGSGLKVCLLADSSKEGKVSLAHICGWEAIDIFITDKIAEGRRRELEERGVTVVVAE